jgi:hypothetical protein
LDFDLLLPKDISNNKRKEKEEFVFREMKEILKKYAELEIREAVIKHYYTIFFLLSYGKGEHTLKIEISRRPGQSKFVIKNYLGIPMLVTTKRDAFANKLVALLDRKKTAMRDAFDVNFFLEQMWDINEKIIKEKTGMSLQDYLKQCINFVEKLFDKHILDGLGEILTENQKDSARDSLKKNLLFNLRSRAEMLKVRK